MTKKRKTIIIVDDNNSNLVACKNILKPFYEVFPAPSAAKMFELLERIVPDMILLDIEMPDIDGYETAQMLRDSEEFENIPFIFLTSRSDTESELKGLSMGAQDFIHKPFVSPLLLRRIEIHLSLIDHQKTLEERKESVEKMLEIKTKEVMHRKSAEIEAARAMQSKDELFNRMNNEIRAPLNAASNALAAALDSGNTDKKDKCLKNTDGELKRLLTVLDDMLAV